MLAGNFCNAMGEEVIMLAASESDSGGNPETGSESDKFVLNIWKQGDVRFCLPHMEPSVFSGKNLDSINGPSL